MGRRATKAADNRWYQARLHAVRRDNCFSSRPGAAERLGVCEDVLKRAEYDEYKTMPVDIAMLMAREYNAPQLENYYCKQICPMGKNKPIADEIAGLEHCVLGMLKMWDEPTLDELKRGLIDIAEDGVISSDERDQVLAISDKLKEMEYRISEFQILVKKVIADQNLQCAS